MGGIERDIFRVINTLNKKDKKSQQYLKVVGLTKKKEYQKVFNENKPLKNENEKMNVEKNRSWKEIIMIMAWTNSTTVLNVPLMIIGMIVIMKITIIMTIAIMTRRQISVVKNVERKISNQLL